MSKLQPPYLAPFSKPTKIPFETFGQLFWETSRKSESNAQFKKDRKTRKKYVLGFRTTPIRAKKLVQTERGEHMVYVVSYSICRTPSSANISAFPNVRKDIWSRRSCYSCSREKESTDQRFLFPDQKRTVAPSISHRNYRDFKESPKLTQPALTSGPRVRYQSLKNVQLDLESAKVETRSNWN